MDRLGKHFGYGFLVVRCLSIVSAVLFLVGGCDTRQISGLGTFHAELYLAANENGNASGNDNAAPGNDNTSPPPDGGVINPPEVSLPCITCHSAAMGPRRVIVDATLRGGHQFGGDEWTNDECLTCHELTRHQEGNVRLWVDPSDSTAVIALAGDPSRDAAEADKVTPFCARCHTDANARVHNVSGAWRPACTACHNVHEAESQNQSLIAKNIYNPVLQTEMPVVFTARQGVGSFDDGNAAVNDGVCQVCHTATRYHLKDGTGVPHNDAMDCTECHAHTAGFAPPGADELSCLECHTVSQGRRPAVVNAAGGGGHHLAGGLLTADDCVVCHEMTRHQNGAVRLWANPNNPSTVIVLNADPGTVPAEANKLTPFCQSCHNGAQHAPHTVSGAWQPTCTACHDIHDYTNTNLALIARTIRNVTLGIAKPVSFTARTGSGSFDDGDAAANDGICQVCHTLTSYHRHDGSAPAHNDGLNCTTCHTHAAGFVPGDLSCTECHNAPRGPRREIVSEFSLATHHVLGPVEADDCQACHDISQHQGGHVRLKNADDPSNAAAVVTLSGSPLASFTEAAKLEPVCLACHDHDGAGGRAPFADGVMPAPIGASDWAVSSHKAAQTTCMGEGETFGCHASGHGSVKDHLLAPWSGGQSAVSGDPLREEEGMCYTCHDADGPASTDVESTFAQAHHHNVSAVDHADGSRLECTNCHDPHTVSASAKVVDPMTGTAWSGTGEAFCLTCHGGDLPAGVSFPPNSTGSGLDKSSFVNSTHDVETGSDSCRQCHEHHGSDHPGMLLAAYATADGRSYGADKYALCWSCHDEGYIMSENNIFGELHKKHVREKGAPCIICHGVHASFDPGEPGLIDLDFAVRSGAYNIQFAGGRDGSSSFWIDSDTNRGNCFLTCHGEEHEPKGYNRQ